MKLTTATFVAVLCGAVILPAMAAQTAPPDTSALPSFNYHYNVSWGAIGVGTLDLSLKPQVDHAGCYRYATTTAPNALVAMFYGAPSQSSDFCIVDDHVRSQHFVSKLPGDDKQSYTLDFDWSRHQVVDENSNRRDIPDDAVDSLALQQAVRLWVLDHRAELNASTQSLIAKFTMVDNKHLTHYQFKFGGEQKIDTPAGHFDTLLMDRVDTPGKIGRFWLAPSRGYMPVKSETKIGGKPAVTMALAK